MLADLTTNELNHQFRIVTHEFIMSTIRLIETKSSFHITAQIRQSWKYLEEAYI